MRIKRFAAFAAAMCLLVLSGCGGEDAPATGQPGQGQETGQVTGAPEGGQGENTDLLARIRDKGEITIALEGNWSPWGYHDEDDKLVGYDVEIGEKIAEKLGVKVNFVESGWDSLLAGVESGRFDMIINGVDVDEDRQAKFELSTPYAYGRTVVIVRSDDDSIQEMEDLDGKSTANTLQSTYANVAESYGASVTPVDDFIQTIELLTAGRIDATLNAEVSFFDYLSIHPDAPVKIACYDSQTTEQAIVMTKGETALREAVDKALEEMREDGTLTQLSEKYFGTDISKN